MDSSSTSAPPGSALKGQTTIEEPDRVQRAIARRSAEVRATVPDLQLSIDADAAQLVERAAADGCSVTALLVSACATALREFPRANGAYRDERYELHSRVNVGVIIQTARAQIPATVLDADRKPAAELAVELARLEARARSGELTPPEQAGATFTFTNLGPHGVHRGDPLVIPPQAAALTAGAVRAVPVLRDGEVVPGHQLTLTLACDHRILFGALAGEFLRRVADLVETGP